MYTNLDAEQPKKYALSTETFKWRIVTMGEIRRLLILTGLLHCISGAQPHLGQNDVVQ
jgi:hypothetical protein